MTDDTTDYKLRYEELQNRLAQEAAIKEAAEREQAIVNKVLAGNEERFNKMEALITSMAEKGSTAATTEEPEAFPDKGKAGIAAKDEAEHIGEKILRDFGSSDALINAVSDDYAGISRDKIKNILNKSGFRSLTDSNIS